MFVSFELQNPMFVTREPAGCRPRDVSGIITHVRIASITFVFSYNCSKSNGVYPDLTILPYKSIDI